MVSDKMKRCVHTCTRPVEKKDDGTRVNMYSASDGAGNTELDHTGATVGA